MELELKENQAVLIVEYRRDGSLLVDVKSGGDSNALEREVCEAISERFEDKEFLQELLDKIEKSRINKPQSDYEKAHKHSIRHRKEIMESKICGCFSCMSVYFPDDIEIWTDDDEKDEGQTALCPHCLVDAVIGDASGFPIINSFLEGMCLQWFGEALVDCYRERTKFQYGAQHG